MSRPLCSCWIWRLNISTVPKSVATAAKGMSTRGRKSDPVRRSTISTMVMRNSSQNGTATGMVPVMPMKDHDHDHDDDDSFCTTGTSDFRHIVGRKRQRLCER